ncbi:hypothetical protein GOV14_04180 [Candidatus Pacearchaeota archaeon]|nr:hypothetical protein [Candidatus Pacearchaeota archaeon]
MTISSQTWIMFGLMLDILGAISLGIPLIKSEREISNQTKGVVLGVDVGLNRSLKRDRRLGIAGLSLLVVGFIFQLIGQGAFF